MRGVREIWSQRGEGEFEGREREREGDEYGVNEND